MPTDEELLNDVLEQNTGLLNEPQRINKDSAPSQPTAHSPHSPEFRQWAVAAGGVYFRPVGYTLPEMPAGVFRFQQDDAGVFLEHELLRSWRAVGDHATGRGEAAMPMRQR